jgi:hypothetical protein
VHFDTYNQKTEQQKICNILGSVFRKALHIAEQQLKGTFVAEQQLKGTFVAELWLRLVKRLQCFVSEQPHVTG